MSDLIDVQGYMCRTDSDDAHIVKEVGSIFKKPGAPEVGDICLDLGAHIGIFTGMALQAGALAVKAIEADAENADLFRRNISDPRVSFVEAAVAGEEGEAQFYINPGKGKCMHSLVDRRGRHSVTVKTTTIEKLCEDFEPTFLKIDIEGGEYMLNLPYSIPKSVDRMFLEFHFGRRSMRLAGEELREKLDKQGWKPVWEDKWYPGAWNVNAVFSR